MSLRVIGFGVGRTGTFSMKLALEALGFGPCHHMEEVDAKSPHQISLWASAAEGKVNWQEAYAGFQSAVDWPTAAFCRELVAEYPDAKFILTLRDPEKWYASFSETIYPLIQPSEETPPELLPFLQMGLAVVRKTGFRIPSTKEEILTAFQSHIETVKQTVPGDRLLLFDVKQGWGPLCHFLDVPVPPKDFPKTNSTQDFYDSIQFGLAASGYLERTLCPQGREGAFGSGATRLIFFTRFPRQRCMPFSRMTAMRFHFLDVLSADPEGLA
jgi:hypothetical protein